MKANETKPIYLLVQPNGELWLEDIKSVFTDEAKANANCDSLNAMEKRENPAARGKWKVLRFAAIKHNDTQKEIFDLDLHERTLLQIAKDNRAAEALWQKIYG